MEEIVCKQKRKYKSVKYCCICKGVSRGQIVDGRQISLHRFPKDKRAKRIWTQRCKTVMPAFKWTEHKRLCSEHFMDFTGPTLEYTLPSRFPTEGGSTKEYSTWNLDENPYETRASDDAVPLESDETMTDDVDNDDDREEPTHNFSITSECHSLDVSLHLHDYCYRPTTEQVGKTRCTDTQTESDQRHAIIQTDVTSVPHTREFSCQTVPATRDMGIQCSLPVLTFDDIKHDNDMVCFYTGMPSREVFEAVFDEIKEEAEVRTSRQKEDYKPSSGGRPRNLSIVNEYLMVLMRLRLGLLIEDLSFRFCISTSQCSNIIERWINYLVVQLSFLVQWPSKETIKANMPRCFIERFSNTRVIIDCTELYSDTASSLSLKSLMYSDYKSHMTYKALVGISPNGIVTFVSDCWVGSTSDKKLTKECGLLDLMEEGDAIMADKGFTISDLTAPKAVHLIIPPFKNKGKQFTKREVIMTKEIASLRIHVERQMERIKNFRILQGNIPITQGRQISKIFKICTYLTNLWPPLIQDN